MIWLVCALFAANPEALDVAAQVAAQLQHPPVVRGTFAQEQQVQGFKKPLLSQGHFLLVRDQGILWDTDKPFPSRLSITRARMLGSRADGSVLVNLGQGAPMGAIHEILFAVLAADVAVLRRHFAVAGTGGAAWKLTLVALPDDPVGHALKEVTLEGGKTVQRIALAETNGDRRTIVLHEQAADAPSPEESKRFE